MHCQLVFTIELYCLVIRFGECNCCVCLLVSNHVPGVDHVSVQSEFKVRWMWSCVHMCAVAALERKWYLKQFRAKLCSGERSGLHFCIFPHWNAVQCYPAISLLGGWTLLAVPLLPAFCRLPSSSVNLSFTAHFHSAHSFPMELSLYCKTCCEQAPFTLTHCERQPPAPAHKKSSRMGWNWDADLIIGFICLFSVFQW